MKLIVINKSITTWIYPDIHDIDTIGGVFFIWCSKNCKTIPDLLAEDIILLYSQIYVIVHLHYDLYAICML